MSKTKLERAAEIEQMIERLKKRRLTLLQAHKIQERKARNHRLCKRSGYLEKVILDLATLTDEQFEIFVKKTLQTNFAERILRGLVPAAPETESPASNNKLPTEKENNTNSRTARTAADPANTSGNASGEPAKAAG